MPKTLFAVITLLFAYTCALAQLPDSKLAADTRATLWPQLQTELHNKGLIPGSALFIRIFKEEHNLEIWVKSDQQYRLFKTYPICYFSGGLGTKTYENDGKSPEGFYTIAAKQLNPQSNYHLAINIGYPNQLEKMKGYTGTDIMINGNCVSIGCYAMTDRVIDEIYTLVYKSLEAGQQSIPVHIFPFRLKADYLKNLSASAYYNLWSNMKPGYDLFERDHIPPQVSVVNKQYAFK
jgi:murein L,D-transpeptidase YafK